MDASCSAGAEIETVQQSVVVANVNVEALQNDAQMQAQMTGTVKEGVASSLGVETEKIMVDMVFSRRLGTESRQLQDSSVKFDVTVEAGDMANVIQSQMESLSDAGVVDEIASTSVVEVAEENGVEIVADASIAVSAVAEEIAVVKVTPPPPPTAEQVTEKQAAVVAEAAVEGVVISAETVNELAVQDAAEAVAVQAGVDIDEAALTDMMEKDIDSVVDAVMDEWKDMGDLFSADNATSYYYYYYYYESGETGPKLEGSVSTRFSAFALLVIAALWQ